MSTVYWRLTEDVDGDSGLQIQCGNSEISMTVREWHALAEKAMTASNPGGVK